MGTDELKMGIAEECHLTLAAPCDKSEWHLSLSRIFHPLQHRVPEPKQSPCVPVSIDVTSGNGERTLHRMTLRLLAFGMNGIWKSGIFIERCGKDLNFNETSINEIQLVNTIADVKNAFLGKHAMLSY